MEVATRPGGGGIGDGGDRWWTVEPVREAQKFEIAGLPDAGHLLKLLRTFSRSVECLGRVWIGSERGTPRMTLLKLPGTDFLKFEF